jgi:hypothetical protein
MEVSGQFHAPAALPPVKPPGTHWIGGWVGPRTGLDAVVKKIARTQTSDHPARLRESGVDLSSLV